jgi:hypothetical protein
LQQDACTVTCVGLGPRRASVLKIGEGSQASLNQFVGLFAAEIRDERHAT